MIPYAAHEIDEADVAAVAEALRSGWLTTGPLVGRLEAAFAEAVGAAHAVAVNSGTAALHAATAALGFGPGDEVVVPAITFAASANAVLYVGATPVFADVEADTLLVDPQSVAARIGPRTRAIVAVDYAGQPADYPALQALADRHGLAIVADACHAPGGRLGERRVGQLATVSTFSLHPAKHVTAGEGGLAVTDDASLAERMRRFRSHGIAGDHRERQAAGAHAYDMTMLGYNYRIPDLLCALALSQLRRLSASVARRRAIAARYDAAFADLPAVAPLRDVEGHLNARHLYVVRLDVEALGRTRDAVFAALRARGVGANVHYLPVYRHSYYRERFGDLSATCPVAENAYRRILTLPLFPSMTDGMVETVVAAVRETCS